MSPGNEVKFGRTLASTSPRDEIRMSPLLLVFASFELAFDRPKTGDHE